MSVSTGDIAARLESSLRATGEFSGRVVTCRPMSGGACQENFFVELETRDGVSEYVLRSDAVTSLPGSIGRQEEFEVIQIAVDAGVPTPAVWGLTKGVVRPDACAYLLEFLPGEAIGARVTRHPKYDDCRASLSKSLAKALAKIHSIRPERVGKLGLDRPCFSLAKNPAREAVSFLKGMLKELEQVRPATELGVLWLEENIPPLAQTTLVHGDFRTGNFMVDERGLVGVLDWEFAHWGDPVEDIGWLCVRDWRFGCIDRPAGGVDSRASFCAHYRSESGNVIDRHRLHWWEICGNLRWAVAASIQGLRYQAGGDFELLAIPRRAVEMEYEALRLIETGPSDDA